jgi:ABC-2 type transport system ATP-binding protein
MQQCGLSDVHRKIIGHLSKGYQQRVGLADALIHEPELIILDEPTIGLDPNQIRSVRQLIKDLGQKHTVLISTHILPEVEMTCTRVLILHRGRILAADTTENLQHLMSDRGQVVAEIAAPHPDLKACWEEMPEIEHFDLAATDGDYVRCSLVAQNGIDLRPLVFAAVCQRGWPMRELTRSRHSLEDIFVRVTRPDKEEEAS